MTPNLPDANLANRWSGHNVPMPSRATITTVLVDQHDKSIEAAGHCGVRPPDSRARSVSLMTAIVLCGA
ncbi:hypothetical protein ACFYSW_12245 [Rhodococcus aetherivorans]|uniref:hypothetical protein n=1 Tax=Rhodococcus aetherivorans TaxID=191292 RepID=UPI0036B95C55